MSRRGTAKWVLGCAAFLALAQSGVLLQTEIGAIRLYQRVGSPLLSHFVRCRFDPTCSHYAVQVLERDGLWKGNLETAVRLIHCSPIGWAYDQIAGA